MTINQPKDHDKLTERQGYSIWCVSGGAKQSVSDSFKAFHLVGHQHNTKYYRYRVR